MKRVLMVLILALGLLVSGCWDQKEINDLALVVAVAEDVAGKNMDKITVTLQIANPAALIPGQSAGGASMGAGGPRAFWTVAGTGQTVRDAFMKTNHLIPKNLFFGHTRVMIIGEQAARKGVFPFLDWALRGEQTRQTMYVTVARGEARRVLELEMPTFRATGLAISDLFDIKGGNHGIMPVTLNQFYYDFSTGSTSPVAPVVSVIPQTSISAEDKKQPGAGTQTIRMAGLAVFNPKGKLVGFLDVNESLGVMWLRHQVRNLEVTVPGHALGLNAPVVLNGVKSQSRIIVHAGTAGIPSFEVRTKTIFDISEQFGVGRGFMSRKDFEDLDEHLDSQVDEQIKSSFSKAQALHADIFGFGEEVKRQHPKLWRQISDRWPEIFANVKVSVKAESILRHRGLLVEPPGTIRERE